MLKLIGNKIFLSLLLLFVLSSGFFPSKAYADWSFEYYNWTGQCLKDPPNICNVKYFTETCGLSTNPLSNGQRTGTDCCINQFFFQQCVQTNIWHNPDGSRKSTPGQVCTDRGPDLYYGFQCYTPSSSTTPPPTATPTPIPGIVTIQGRHVDSFGGNLVLSGQRVTVNPGNRTTSSSPSWSFNNLSTGGYTVSATEIPGYQISWTKCINCTPSSNAAYTTGDLTTVTLSDNGDFANIYFKYTRVSCNSYSNCSSCILDLRCGWGVKDGNSFCTDWNSACRPQGYTGWYWQSCSTNENSCGAPAPTPLPSLYSVNGRSWKDYNGDGILDDTEQYQKLTKYIGVMLDFSP